MQPHPGVSQDQGQGHIEEPQQRIAGRGSEASSLELPITRFDREAASVELTKLVAIGVILPGDEHVDLALADPLVAVFDDLPCNTNGVTPRRGRDGLFIGIPARSGPLKGAKAGRLARTLRLSSAEHCGHDERPVFVLQQGDDRAVGELTIEQNDLDFQSGLANLGDQSTQDTDVGIAGGDGGQGDREASAVKHDGGGSVDVEGGGTLVGFAASELVGGSTGFAMIGDAMPVDGEWVSTASQ